MSYIDKALSQSETPRRKLKGTTGSQADFIQALRILGTVFSSRTSQLDPWQPIELGIEAVFLNCSLETWEWVFGTPRNVIYHSCSAVKRCVKTWECLCEDGVVMCVGHLVQLASGSERVVLTRILYGSPELAASSNGSRTAFSAWREPLSPENAAQLFSAIRITGQREFTPIFRLQRTAEVFSLRRLAR